MSDIQTDFVKALTSEDNVLWSKFKALLAVDGKTQFSSDDFRDYKLDRYLYEKQHGIGGFFARLLANGQVKEAGWKRSRIASNHGRKIRVYELADVEVSQLNLKRARRKYHKTGQPFRGKPRRT